ncbi:peptidoglycan-binding domain-containing protein [Terasakiella pusilla]|uniref:peptidoglycan-binding domain-containing protein n=1 Tax=Terasakiella pusilla TaxID=64973 RepID=UPI003AA7B198
MVENSFWNSLSSGFSNFANGVSDFFSVDSTVSPTANMKGDDVLKTKSALNALGQYKAPDFGITDIPDTEMIQGLKYFQESNGLKVDGIMKPGGPTEKTLGQTLANNGLSTTDLLEQGKKQGTITPLTQAPSDKPQTSWAASVAFDTGKVTPIPDMNTQPKKAKIPKIDPMTGLADLLALAPKGKMPTKKQWEEVAKMKQEKAQSKISIAQTSMNLQNLGTAQEDMGKNILQQLRSGNPQNAFNQISQLRARDENAFQALPDEVKSAYESYIMGDRSKEPQHMYDPKNKEKAISKGLSEGASFHTGQDLINKTKEKGHEAIEGLGRVYGVDHKTIDNYGKNNKDDLEEIAIPTNYEGRTIAKQFGQLVDYLPGVGGLITAKEYGELAQQSGLNKNTSQAAAIAGLFTGKAAKVVAKYGSKGADYIVKSITGKGLSELSPELTPQIKEKLTEFGIDKLTREAIENVLP